MSILGGLFKIAKAKEDQRVSMEASAHELFSADTERIKGLRAENILTEQLFDALANQQVAGIASGIDPSSPVAQTLRRKTVKRGEREIKKIKTDTILADQRRRARSRGLLRAGKFARIGGIVEGISDIQEQAGRIAAAGA